ncbi:MAG: hypothetical protein AB1640_09360 [bacterium]
MQGATLMVDRDRYAQCIEVSKRVRWDIDKDVIRGRLFDFSKKFLPDGISKLNELELLNEDDIRVLSQIQGRTYSNMFGFVERFITAKILELSRNHWLGDQVALEALVRFCDEELKHQELFRRLEQMIAEGMPDGYLFPHDPNVVAADVLSHPTWSVLGLIYEIELFTQEHYRKSIEPDPELSPLYKDVFLFHAREESTHAIMDSLEWPLEDKKLADAERDRAVDELIGMVGAVDGLLQAQAQNDADYFLSIRQRSFKNEEIKRIQQGLLKAYRWQYIFSGVEDRRFQRLLGSMINEGQGQRLQKALGGLQ